MKTVDQFELQERIGAGGMGVVYKALDTRLQRTVALKFLSREMSHEDHAQERQLREARAAAALNHPNIATIYDVGKSDKGHYIVMEHIEGDLLFHSARGEHLPMDVAIDWATQLCEAISAAHDQGIIHRDIKSSNVMITKEGRLKVLDFGVALWHDSPNAGKSAHATRLTSTGAIVGTIDYIAPEVLQGRSSAPASDVFSIGVLLYEMMTGRLPFEGDAPVSVMYAIANVDPAPVVDLRCDACERVNAVIMRALEKDPQQRFANARELLKALRRATGKPTPSQAAISTRPAEDTPTNLPALTSKFVGRTHELGELEDRLSDTRLLTITGPGGAGKTRISLELANRVSCRFADGVFLIELAALTDAHEVERALARVLGVREESDQPLIETVAEWVDRSRVLFVLDNCEHLIEASAVTARRLLELAPNITIIATSQERLGIPGEVVWQLSTLSLPDSAASAKDLDGFEAIQLFVDRAKQVKPSFEITDTNADVIAQICRQLDGIPLAIELAAVRVRMLPPEKILGRLSDRFKLLTGGNRTSLERQQTLRAAVEWSLDLLDDAERRLFSGLSVFSGGMDLEGVENVCGMVCDECEDVLDLLARLVDKSLVVVRDVPEGEPRYDLLHTLREYGQSSLRLNGDEKALRDKHAEYFTELGDAAGPQLTGPDQAQWLRRLELESDNLTTAIVWLLRRGKPDQALAIAAGVWRFWFVRGYLGTGRELLEIVIGATTTPTPQRAEALYGAGVLAHDMGDAEAATAHFEWCLGIRRRLGDRAGEAQTLNNMGVSARDDGDYPAARELLEQSIEISRDIGNDAAMAQSLHALGITAHREADCRTARDFFEKGLDIRERLGDRRGIGALLAHIGSIDYDLGDAQMARPLLEQSMTIFRELENKRGIAFASMYLGGVAQVLGDLDAARDHHMECLEISRDLGDKEHIVCSFEWLARVAAGREDYRRAFELEGAAAAFREQFKTPRTPIEEQSIDKDLSAAGAALGSEGVEHARATGQLRSLETAIAFALSDH